MGICYKEWKYIKMWNFQIRLFTSEVDYYDKFLRKFAEGEGQRTAASNFTSF